MKSFLICRSYSWQGFVSSFPGERVWWNTYFCVSCNDPHYSGNKTSNGYNWRMPVALVRTANWACVSYCSDWSLLRIYQFGGFVCVANLSVSIVYHNILSSVMIQASFKGKIGVCHKAPSLALLWFFTLPATRRGPFSHFLWQTLVPPLNICRWYALVVQVICILWFLSFCMKMFFSEHLLKGYSNSGQHCTEINQTVWPIKDPLSFWKIYSKNLSPKSWENAEMPE